MPPVEVQAIQEVPSGRAAIAIGSFSVSPSEPYPITAFGSFTVVILALGLPLTGRAQPLSAAFVVAGADGFTLASALTLGVGVAVLVAAHTSSMRPVACGSLVEHAPSASRATAAAISFRMYFPPFFKIGLEAA
ncbi:hypothetical protein ACTI_42020 [Actinoplanes sp. OR16]|nr:hypothetical protein ACTI_42020 [Actinoplanes sp. OR16]